jgi:hypothetical protein
MPESASHADPDDTSGFTMVHQVSEVEYVIVTMHDSGDDNWNNDDSSNFDDDFVAFDDT